MSKKDAIYDVRLLGCEAVHPQSGGAISVDIKVTSFCPRREERQLKFYGDCSPKDGWETVWLGER